MEAPMKRRIIEEMQRKRQQSQADAGRAVEEVFGALDTVLQQDGKATVPGFGTFKRSFRPEREARNPRTGESVRVGAKHVIKFSEPRDRVR
jgi:DNA-binding protein HU-beta